MNMNFIDKIKHTIDKSVILEAHFHEVENVPAFGFDFLLDGLRQQGALLIDEGDDFNLIQIFVRYTSHPIPQEKTPLILTLINRLNGISIGGLLMLQQENNEYYVHFKANLFLSKKSINDDFPENDMLVFINSNLNILGAFNNDLFK
tara:strand:- start:51 stop:491 length:441 start_codon:yes stop_codon:yes gene_type:complete